MSLKLDETTDNIISAVLVIFLGVSVCGNTAAFVYFWKNRHKSLPNKLYMTIIVVDLITSFSSIPVIISLSNFRKPMIFESSTFCVTHLVSVIFSMRMSMFLVAVLSIARTISIVIPHRTKTINSKLIAASIICYGALLLGVDGLFIANRWFTVTYDKHMPACMLSPTTRKPIPTAITLTNFILTLVEILIPPVVVSVSLVISLVSLKNSHPKSNNGKESESLKISRPKPKKVSEHGSQKMCHPFPSSYANTVSERGSRMLHVSITVALFTILHLLSTLPLFTYILCQLILRITPIPQLSQFLYKDMIWYGQITFILLPASLNSALNPCLYLWRMRRFRKSLYRVMSSVSTRKRS